MRVVIDTNILISGIFFGGKPRQVLEKWFLGLFDVVCTKSIFAEYSATIRKLSEEYNQENRKDISFILTILIKNLIFIDNSHSNRYSRDPADDKFVNCAINGNAKYIITGDKDILCLRKIENITMLKADKFLALF